MKEAVSQVLPVTDIWAPFALEDTWVTAMGKATKNNDDEETQVSEYDPSLPPPMPQNTEKSTEHPGNTLTKSQENQRQH